MAGKKARRATVKRETRETSIRLSLNLDGAGRYRVETGIPFMNHMLELFSKHSLIDCDLRAEGDLAVDYHHTVEDLGLALGEALDKGLGERRGIGRYGAARIPMDDAMASAAVDLGGRPYLVWHMANRKRKIRDFDLGLIEHFFRSFTDRAGMNLHIDQSYGDDPHHAYEAVFKAFARSLRMACELDPRNRSIPSSKGTVTA